MPNPYSYEYEFHPVSQGLFACGAIYRQSDDACQFRWVYDCGTTSDQDLVANAIKAFEARIGQNHPRLDLTTISHFDEDHISGITELLRKFPVDNLMLPYMPLSERMLIAFEEGVALGSDAMRFFVDPVTYLTTLDGAQIGRIILVPPSGGTSDAPPEPGVARPPDTGDAPWTLGEYRKQPVPPEDSEFAPRPDSTTQIHFLAAGAVISVSQLWEFVPYNDQPPRGSAITPEFRAAVEARRNSLLRAKSTDERQKALADLKDIYDKHFKDTSFRRNVISLHLYGGPIYASWKTTRFAHPHKDFCPICTDFYLPQSNDPALAQVDRRSSVLYTGDGYLNTPARLDRFVDYLRLERIERSGVFQVMHHGAEGNWHEGVADRIQPLYSVFSSNPNHGTLKHPHPPVLRDFWKYHPIQVNEHFRAVARGWLVPH